METIFELTGRTAFLNGTQGLHDGLDKPLFNKMQSHNLDVIIIDNLFEDAAGLKKLWGVSNLVLFTLGQDNDKLQTLIAAFHELKFVPKAVIFMSDGTAEIFIGLARELKKKGTEFYFWDCIGKEILFEIGWI